MSDSYQARLDHTVNVAAVMDYMNQVAPPELAEAWDPVGLAVGQPAQPVRSVLIALDLTEAVFKKARSMDQPMIITHHPPIFNPLASLRMDNPVHSLLVRLAASGISVFAAHTNLDSAPGGVADSLLQRISLAPELGGCVTETKAVCTYGRTLLLNKPLKLSVICEAVKSTCNSPCVWLNDDQDSTVQRIAVFPGSFPEETFMELLSEQIDTVICGEFKHSAGVAFRTGGIRLVAIGHDVSERVVLQPLRERLASGFPELAFAVCHGLDYNSSVFRVSRTAAGADRKVVREESPGSTGQGAG